MCSCSGYGCFPMRRIGLRERNWEFRTAIQKVQNCGFSSTDFPTRTGIQKSEIQVQERVLKLDFILPKLQLGVEVALKFSRNRFNGLMRSNMLAEYGAKCQTVKTVIEPR